MENFEEFVGYVVKKWRKEKKGILEHANLGWLSNREYGDLAEDYILRQTKKLIPKYSAFKSTGSQSPADIFAYSRRNGYWHIMLIQVKSSGSKTQIEKLNQTDKKVFIAFAKFIKKEIDSLGLLDSYKTKSVFISTGYAAVLRTKTGNRLVEAKGFNVLKANTSGLNFDKIKLQIIEAHQLKINK